jgi:hypothetical protein
MNHRFKIATDWKPQHLHELINSIHYIVRLYFFDLKRALYGLGNYELQTEFKHFYIPQTNGVAKSSDEKDKLFQRFLKNKQFSSAVIQSTDDRFTIPNVKHLARKPGQRQRPKTTAATILSRFHI